VLDARFETEAVSNVNEIFGTAIPLEGPLSLGMVLRRDASHDAKTASGRVQVSASEFSAEAEGDFSWPLRAGNGLRLTFETPSLASLSRWLPGDYLDPGPLSFESNFEIDSQNAPLGNFSMILGNNDLSGEAHLQGIDLSEFPDLSVNPGKKIRITGELKSSRLNTIEILPSRKSLQRNRQSQEAIFSSDPFPLDWFQNLDLDISLKANELVTRGFEAEEFNGKIKVADRVLDVSAASGEFSGGNFEMDIVVDTRAAPYAIDFKFEVAGLVLEQVPALQHVDLPVQGAVDVNIDLVGNGISPKEIVSHSSGSIRISGTQAKMTSNSERDFLTGSIIFEFLDLITQKEKTQVHSLDCGFIGFRVVDGIAMSQDTVVLQTPDVTYLISGGFSLKDESVAFMINPKARKGLGVSAANLANFRRIGGSLRNPKPETDPEGLVRTGVKWGLAAFTSGLSILGEGINNKFIGNKNVCQAAEDNQLQLLEESPECVAHAWQRLTSATPLISPSIGNVSECFGSAEVDDSQSGRE
jgi:uncharacterized protein involved in outer membrane biogenesis